MKECGNILYYTAIMWCNTVYVKILLMPINYSCAEIETLLSES